MADDLRNRGGEVDPELLANELGAPVALISAARGEGISPSTGFLTGGIANPKPVELPVLQDVPKCRPWAARICSEVGYRACPAAHWTRRLDAVFLHPIVGPSSSPSSSGGLSDDLHRRKTHHGRARERIIGSGSGLRPSCRIPGSGPC